MPLSQLVPNAPAHTLVGRIGTTGSLDDLSGFLVGSVFEKKAIQPGRLFLGFNDGFVKPDRTGLDPGGVGDNSGNLQATIDDIGPSPGIIPPPPPIPITVLARKDTAPDAALDFLIGQGIKTGLSEFAKWLFNLGPLAARALSFGLGLLTAPEILLTADSTCKAMNPQGLDICNTTEVSYKTESPASVSIRIPAGILAMRFDFLPLSFASTDRVFAYIEDELLFNVPGSLLNLNSPNGSMFLEFPDADGGTVKIGLSSNDPDRRMIVSDVEFFSPVPEPSTLTLFVSSLAALVGIALRCGRRRPGWSK